MSSRHRYEPVWGGYGFELFAKPRHRAPACLADDNRFSIPVRWSLALSVLVVAAALLLMVSHG